jgi:hypothetical protein
MKIFNGVPVAGEPEAGAALEPAADEVPAGLLDAEVDLLELHPATTKTVVTSNASQTRL